MIKSISIYKLENWKFDGFEQLLNENSPQVQEKFVPQHGTIKKRTISYRNDSSIKTIDKWKICLKKKTTELIPTFHETIEKKL